MHTNVQIEFVSLIGDYLDILAVSCDSFNEDTNKVIGRGQGRKSHLDKLHQVRNWCRDYKVAFKINSVINTYNVDEDMTEQIPDLNPVRWKVQLYFITADSIILTRLQTVLLRLYCNIHTGVPVSAN